MGVDETDAEAAEFGPSDMRAVFAASGQVGRDLLAIDWSANPLGSPATWPQSLKTVVGVLLSSRFSMWMAWGPELTMLVNDTYRRHTLGEKYPWALGRSAREVWAEIWSDIGPLIEEVMTTGVASWADSLLLFLERSGYREETYHTFSYIPLSDDDGQIAGMLCVVSEETDRVIGERRMTTLRELGAELNGARTEAEVFDVAERRLGADLQSLPFALIYRFVGDGLDAHLTAAAGAAPGEPVAPRSIGADAPRPIWPIDAVALGRSVVVDDLAQHFTTIPSGGWDEPPTAALVVPLLAPTGGRPFGFLVAGLNRYRLLDTAYEGFITLVASQISSSIANARAYEAERQRAETLAELDRAKTAFFTNVSHEFRTPLTLLLGPAEDALADDAEPLGPVQRARIELVDRNAQRLLKLVNTLLDFSRIESGRVRPRFEAVEIVRYTSELVELFRPAVERAGLQLELELEPIEGPVYLDREMWAKIVYNLLSNALKFTFEGSIAVRLGPSPDDLVELAVRDSGIGIAPQEQAHLFERFHRVDGARSRTYEGSGIGLALVAELVALHHGSVAARSVEGVGSTFTVRVPAGTGHLDESTLALEPSGDADATLAERLAPSFVEEALRWLDDADETDGGDGGETPLRLVATAGEADERPRLLVVDDNADMRRHIAALLGDVYHVDVAADGLIALDRVRAAPPDLVLTDVMMPNLDGFGLLSALRNDPVTAHVPVVMLSARAGEEAAVEGLEAGADDYLVKPFSALELVARVRSNLELERTRRAADRDRALLAEVELSRDRLDRAQQMARIGSWDLDLRTGAVTGSRELLRMLGLTESELGTLGVEAVLARHLHPDELARAEGILAAAREGHPIAAEFRSRSVSGEERVVDVRGEVMLDESGQPARVRGSLQDVTEQRATERALARAALVEETARQEHRIAEDLQNSLVPSRHLTSAHLAVASYYQAGVRGTEVGGDWYDVIDLGAGRLALVIGDVMGRGVRAAAVMGQVRAAVRAYSGIGIPPADLLEFLDATVRELDGGQIVTCVYAVYDPADDTLVYANAGHLPPLLLAGGGPSRRLDGVIGPPLGAGPISMREEAVQLERGAIVVLYTDGLVERRDTDLDVGIDSIAVELEGWNRRIEDFPDALVETLRPSGSDDDVAILVAQVPEHAERWATASIELPSTSAGVALAREYVATTLAVWSISASTIDDAVLIASELVTNAIVHGRGPAVLRMWRTPSELILEVRDRANFFPRKQRATADDEHGRGLQIVELLADRWGSRLTDDGKTIWCSLTLRAADRVGRS